MGITTTESINKPKGPRCDRCGKVAPGGAVLVGDGLRTLGICCATGRRREELLALFGGEEPKAEEELLTVIGHDPFDKAKGAHQGVVPVIEGVQKLQRFNERVGLWDQADKYRSASPEAVKAAQDGGFIKGHEPKAKSDYEPSIPPPPGQLDPVLVPPKNGDYSVPVGSRRRSRSQ